MSASQPKDDLLQSCERKLQNIRHICEVICDVICDVMKGRRMKLKIEDIDKEFKCVTQIRDTVKQAVNTAQQTQVCTALFNMGYPFNRLQLQGL